MDLNPTYWIMQTVAMMLTVFLIPRLTVSGPIPAFLTVLSLGFINTHVWDAALFLKVPDSLTVQAATLLITNGAIFWIVVKLLPGIEVKGALPSVAAPIVFTVIGILIKDFDKSIDWHKVGEMSLQYLEQLKTFIGSQKDAHKASLELLNFFV